jgi:hypothetical protein
MNLLSEVRVDLLKVAVAAGTTLVVSSTIDMLGFRGILGIALLGDNADTAVPEFQVFHGDLANGSDAVKLAGTADLAALTATSGDDKMLLLDVEHPMKRYVTFKLERNTANIALAAMIAVLYKARDIPVTQGAGVLSAVGLYNPDAA